MGWDHCIIEIMNVPVQLASGIGLRLYRREELAPNARPRPTVKATGHGAPWPIAFGQLTPGSAGA
jgi:hypothetical protein